jgi:hypothetical protein
MTLIREDDGSYRLELTADDDARFPAAYKEAFVRYLTVLDPAFSKARERSEFDFILALLRVKGVEDAGWDPYETSLAAMESTVRLSSTVKDFADQRHLHLWIYGHLVEASEPYEVARNMLGIANGEDNMPFRFPPKRNGWPQWPGEKISQIETFAASVGMPEVAAPFRERWDRELRNAIFHADYALHGDEIRIRRPGKIYSGEDFLRLLNPAKACHDAMAHLQKAALMSYDAPKLVRLPAYFSRDPHAFGQVIVREGEGLAGIRSAWTVPPRPSEGERIRWHLGRFYSGEGKFLEAGSESAVLPRPKWKKGIRPPSWCPE